MQKRGRARERGEALAVITLSGRGGQGCSAQGDIEFTWDSSVAALSSPVVTSPLRTCGVM